MLKTDNLLIVVVSLLLMPFNGLHSMTFVNRRRWAID
jgi:hypothetical protein